jgi:hypothetical protein
MLSAVFSGLFHGAIFLAAVVGGCAALGALAPFPEVQGIHPKWRYFSQHKDRYDTLFVGSSRFYHQIRPRRFDAAVARAGGQGISSFNFGYDALWPPESYYLLRRVLALRPARLRWVVIDLMAIDSRLEARNEATQRTAYWHDLRHTALALRDVREKKIPAAEKRRLGAAHVMIAARTLANLGRGAELLARRLIPPRVKKPLAWEAHEGWQGGPRQSMTPEEAAHLARAVEYIKKTGLPPRPIEPVWRDALAALIAEVRAVGAEPIFVIAPNLEPRENYSEIPAQAAVIRLNDPRRHPELFDPAHHYDGWHLNDQGAEIFTDLLAAEFVALTQ